MSVLSGAEPHGELRGALLQHRLAAKMVRYCTFSCALKITLTHCFAATHSKVGNHQRQLDPLQQRRHDRVQGKLSTANSLESTVGATRVRVSLTLSGGLQRLFGYIQGHNEANVTIPMTVPVKVEVVPGEVGPLNLLRSSALAGAAKTTAGHVEGSRCLSHWKQGVFCQNTFKISFYVPKWKW